MQIKRNFLALISAVIMLCGVCEPARQIAVEKYTRQNIGVDVSSYQGKIYWHKLSEQIDFAYIKATEGKSFTDDCFYYNAENALQEDIKVGAYHFFSFESDGAEQGENFSKALKDFNFSLAPCIDVELYGEYKKNPRSADSVKKDFDDLVLLLQKRFEQKPIIYTTLATYLKYKSIFDGYDLWIRDVNLYPFYADFKIWQYSDKGRLDGYNGQEEYIDLNCMK